MFDVYLILPAVASSPTHLRIEGSELLLVPAAAVDFSDPQPISAVFPARSHPHKTIISVTFRLKNVYIHCKKLRYCNQCATKL